MNIRRKTGKMVCVQKSGHRTLCGQSMTKKEYDPCRGRSIVIDNYIETNEACTCQKCLELLVNKFINRKNNMPDVDIDK